MIKKDYFETRIDGEVLFRTYSDEGYFIRQRETGIIYEEAVDVEGAPYTYEETDEKIEQPQENEESND